MYKYFRIFFITILFFSLTMSLASAQIQSSSPKIMAVYFYANWCGTCKVLSPKLDEAKKNGKLNSKDILFVTFDLSDKQVIHQTILMANVLGISDYLREQGSATGYVALLDAKSKKEIKRFDSGVSAEEIVRTVDGYLE